MLIKLLRNCYSRLVILLILVSTAVLYCAIYKRESKLSLNSKITSVNSVFANKSQNNFANQLKASVKSITNIPNGVYRFEKGAIADIKLAVVLCGERLNQTIVTLKSAIIFSKQTLHFVIVVDDENRNLLISKLLHWPDNVLSRLSFEVHSISFPKNEGDVWKNLFKLCACQRLFLPSLLKHIDSVIYVDTDVVFMHPIEDLWKFFSLMNSTHIAALCPEHEDFATGWYNRFARHPFYKPLGVNSGVMLMNLTRMRSFDWESYLFPIMQKYRLNIVWGDQDIINIIFHFHPENLYLLPCEWNYRPDHCMYSSTCKTAELNGIAIIHGNRGVFQNNKQAAFRVIYMLMEKYEMSEMDTVSKLLELIKEYLVKTVATSCGKHLLSIFSSRVNGSPE